MAEITSNNASMPDRISQLTWFLFVLAAVFTYFFGLTIPLLGPDEPRYAQVAREMFERGDWITPTLGGSIWFEKPALLYWLEIVSYKIFGVSEFAARFGPTLFGLGTIFCLWLLGKWVIERPLIRDQRYGADLPKWLAIVGASTLGIIVFARGATFDIILTFPMTAALVCFFGSYIADQRSFVSYYLPLAGFYFFAGVALLAKGLVGIVFPYAIVAFFFVLLRRLPSKRLLVSVVWGTLLSVLVAAIWYLPVYWQNGYHFIDEFFVQHHFQRYLSNKYQHPQPFYFFVWVLPLMTLPWLPLFIAGIWNFVKARIDGWKTGSTHRRDPVTAPLLVFSLAWLLVPLVFFSFSGSKLPGYVLPSVPPAIVIAGELASRLVAGRARWRSALLGVAFSTLVIVCLLIEFVVPRFAEQDSVKSLIIAADASSNSRGKIFSLHTVSHNAEFYGSGRIERTPAGEQRRFNSVQEIVDQMKNEDLQSSIVIMPVAYTREMPVYKMIVPTIIGDNGDFAIVRFSLK